VWLYSLLFPFLQRGGWDLRVIVITFFSGITLIGSSFWAFSQFDLKKIIALSTTSQLRFMLLITSMGFNELTYLHILFHGYFKAMLFMGRGVRIHSNSASSQDLRKLSSSNRNPYIVVFFFLGNLGLIGIPFYGGFWRKHSILIAVSNPYYSLSRVFFVFLIYFARALTIGYSIKTLMLIKGNPTLLVLSNKKKRKIEDYYHLFPEIIPTLFLSLFVIFFPSIYLLYSNIEERYLSLVFSKWDFFILFWRGLLIVNLVIKPSSFRFGFSWRRNQILFFTSLIKNSIKFLRGRLLESLLLKKKIKKNFLFEILNREINRGFFFKICTIFF